MLFVFDFAVCGIAKGRAENANRVLAVALDFEVDGWLWFDGLK